MSERARQPIRLKIDLRLDKRLSRDRMFVVFFFGAVAQLGARFPRTEEAVGSNPISSTKWLVGFGR